MNTGNEFQWRSELRKLGGDVEPARDLWSDIATRIARPRVRYARVAAIAAAFVIVCGAAAIGWQMRKPAPASVATVSQPDSTAAPITAPLAWAMPADPKLAAAARDLDSANVQLQRAIEQNPQAVFLVGLLNRTNDQRMRLLRQAAAG